MINNTNTGHCSFCRQDRRSLRRVCRGSSWSPARGTVSPSRAGRNYQSSLDKVIEFINNVSTVGYTACTSLDPFYKVSYFINWFKTSWTFSIIIKKCRKIKVLKPKYAIFLCFFVKVKSRVYASQSFIE